MTDEPRAASAWLRWAVALALLAVLVQLAADRWHEARGVLTVPSPGWLVPATVAMTIAQLLACEAWRRWVLALGARLAPREACWVVLTSNVARYAPGGLLHYVGRVVLAERRGVPAGTASLATLFDTGGALAAALLVGLGLLAALPAAAPAPAPMLAAATLLALLHPALLNAAIARVAAWRGRPAQLLPFGFGRVLTLLGWHAALWLASGAAMLALAQALGPGTPSAAQALVLVAGLATTWVLGMLTPLAPAGLGVREAGYAALLAQVYPAGWAIAFALAARLLALAGELLACGLALLAGPGPAAGETISG